MGTTRKQARQYVAQELGPWHEGTATGGSSTSQLEDTAWPVKSTTASDQTYKDQFLFRPAAAVANQERSVATYDGPTALLTPDQVWTVAPTAGEAYEVLGVLPASTIHDAINDSLKRLKVVVEFTVAPTVNTTRTSLAALTWLTDPSYVREVGYLASGEARNEVDPFRRVQRGTVVIDGSTLYLNHGWRGYNASDTLYVRALKPAYNHCRASGAGAYGDRDGLDAEAHEAPVDVEWLAAATLVQLWRRHSQELDTSGHALRNRAEAAAWLSDLTRRHFDNRLPPLTYRPVKYWGPGRAA